MSDKPTTTNQTASAINSGISTGVNIAETVAEDLFFADFPLLNIPVIKQLCKIPFIIVGSYISKAVQGGATFIVIDVQVGAEESKMSKALAALIAAEKTGDQNVIKKAIQDYANAQSALTHDDGSAIPK